MSGSGDWIQQGSAVIDEAFGKLNIWKRLAMDEDEDAPLLWSSFERVFLAMTDEQVRRLERRVQSSWDRFDRGFLAMHFDRLTGGGGHRSLVLARKAVVEFKPEELS